MAVPRRDVGRAAGVFTALAIVASATTASLFVAPSELSAEVSPGTTARVSLADDGTEGVVAAEESLDPSISDDGRYVVFESEVALGGVDQNARSVGDDWDVYRRDRDADEDGIFDEVGLDPVTNEVQTRTELVSVGQSQPVGTLFCSGSLFFDLTQVGSSDSETAICTNNGPGPVSVGTPTFSGPSASEFALGLNQCANRVLLATQQCTTAVSYQPTTPAIFGQPDTATLTVATNGPVAPQVALSGNSYVNATLTCTPNSVWSFGSSGGSVDVDSQDCTITGPGPSITIFTPTLTGPDAGVWSISNNTCTGTRAPGANCVVTLTFDPGNVNGSYSATLSIPHNGKASDGTPLAPEGAILSGTSARIALRTQGDPVPPSADNGPQCLTTCGARPGKALAARPHPVSDGPAGPRFARTPVAAPRQVGTPIEADRPSVNPVISADGQFVAFESNANNLIA